MNGMVFDKQSKQIGRWHKRRKGGGWEKNRSFLHEKYPQCEKQETGNEDPQVFGGRMSGHEGLAARSLTCPEDHRFTEKFLPEGDVRIVILNDSVRCSAT